MKKLLTVVLVVFMALGLVACGGNDNNDQTGPVEVTLWHTYTEHHNEFLNKIVDEFNASQTDVKVVAVQQPYQDFDANLLQAIRNGVGPDIVGSFATDIADYLEDDLIVDFAPYINGKDGIANFKDNLIGDLYGEITQWGGNGIYCIPVIVTSEVLFYNKTLFDSLNLTVPTTWAEMEEVSRTIYKATGKPGFGTDSAIDTFQGLLMQNGSGYINAETKAMDVNETVALEQLNFLADGIKEGIFRLPGDDYYLSGPFCSGAVASYIGSSAGVGYATQNDGAFEVACAPIPQANKETNPYISSWGGGYVCFKTTDERAEAAYQFLKWFTKAENCSRWAEQFGALPAYKDALETDTFKNFVETNIAVKALYEQYDCVNWLNSIKGSAAVRTAIDKMISEVCLTGVDAKTAYDTMIATSNKELGE